MIDSSVYENSRHDGHPQGGVARVGTESARRVWNLRARHLAHDPASDALKELPAWRHVRDRLDVPIADADVGLAGDERCQELRDVGARVLVVGVGVDDVVRAQRECAVDARAERGRQTLVAAEPHDVRDAVGARDLRRAIPRAIVDDERLDDVDAGNRRRQIAQRLRQRLGLVEARNLDDELRHVPTSFSITPFQVTVFARA